MKKIIILTGSELRHTFFRKFIALNENIQVINSYCEGLEKSLKKTIVQKHNGPQTIRLKHIEAREQSEKDFFELFVNSNKDYSNPINIKKGEINDYKYTQANIDTKPDLIIAYGCSIIKEPLISTFKDRLINVHLGLSPYYRGSGTNYWPLVNEEPEYVGATFMYMNSGIDTGEIIHQIRATYAWGDTPSQVGNRLILEMAHTYTDLIVRFDQLKKMKQSSNLSIEKVFKNKDFTETSVIKLYQNFENGLIEKHLNEQTEKNAKVPILRNPALEEN